MVGHGQFASYSVTDSLYIFSPKYLVGETIVFLKLDLSLTAPSSPIFLYPYPNPITLGVSLKLA